MKIKLDDYFVDKELEEYLLSQKGITSVSINKDIIPAELEVKFDNKIVTPNIIIKFIMLFLKLDNSMLLDFDKGYSGEVKHLKYVAKDVCCENCFKGFIMSLFDNENIINVKSNFDGSEMFNVELDIDYINISEEELIKYVEEKL